MERSVSGAVGGSRIADLHLRIDDPQMMEVRHEPILTRSAEGMELPDELAPRRLGRRALQVIALLGVVVLVFALAPGLDDVRDRLAGARPGWLALGVALEALSCASYVVLFRPVFCRRVSWRSTWEIAWTELGVGSLVPASGIGGLALGAWVLRRGGMPTDQIARRSVAFFLIKGSVNFVAVAVIGALMATGVVGPHRSLALTALPACASALVIAAVVAVRRLGPGGPGGGLLRAARRALVSGVGEAVEILRAREPLVLARALRHWAFHNAVLWATYHAFRDTPALSIVLM